MMTYTYDLQYYQELEVAVNKFIDRVAPTNYRRTQSVVTPQMISIAEKEIEGKGILHELYREPASITDVPVSDLLYTYTPSKVDTLFSELKQEASTRVDGGVVTNATVISFKDLLAQPLI